MFKKRLVIVPQIQQVRGFIRGSASFIEFDAYFKALVYFLKLQFEKVLFNQKLIYPSF